MKARLVSRGSVLALLLVAAAVGPAITCTPGNSDSGKTTGSGGKGGSTGVTTQTGAGGTTATTGGGGAIVTTGGGGFTGGTTGAGGATVVQKLCATKTTVGNPVLINFETYTGTVTAANYGTAFGGATPNNGTAYTGPYGYGDGTATPDLEILAGHPPSQWAVSETDTQASAWGMGGGIWMSCANASAYKGISFWVRGSGPLNVFSFTVDMESTVMPTAGNAAGGGTCPGTTDTCIPAKKADIPLTLDWTQVQILWADFTPGMSGATAVVPNGDSITGLGWSVPLMFQLSPAAMGDAAGPYVAVVGDMFINIDDVQFIP